MELRVGCEAIELQITPNWTSSSGTVACLDKWTLSFVWHIDTKVYALRLLLFFTALDVQSSESTPLLLAFQHHEMDKSIQSTMGPPAMPAPSAKGRSRPRRTTADDQIDRKRELDRIAQRMSRERTRNRIIFLEQKLKSLEARDRGGQISYLMKVIEDLRRENTQLRASLMKIRFIADDLAEPSSKSMSE